MSRIGKVPVALPSGVSATAEGDVLTVKGPKGTLTMAMLEDISYGIEDGRIVVKPANETKRARSFWGMHRTLVQNLGPGVTEGFSTTRELTSVGNRHTARGKNPRQHRSTTR